VPRASGGLGLLKKPQPFCHPERSEESLILFMGLNLREIPRSARNDKIEYFFSSLGLPEKLSIRGKIKSSWTGSSMVEQLTLNRLKALCLIDFSGPYVRPD